ncbi:MAG: ABC transporter substrate-binding protein [Dehalococcoidia bacterium]|nr:ABC transporter substrate-binding protein [Dehalococcoidia bacterium]
MQHRVSGLVLVAMMIGALVLVLLGEGCSTTPTAPATTGASNSDKPYGNLIITGGFRTGNLLDASGKAIDYGFPFQDLSAAIFDTLVVVSPEGQIAPGLAERWEIAKDGMTQTFYIRKGVKFHNGDDLTAADAKFTFDALIAEGTITPASIWKAAVASIDVKDDYTLVFRMKTPQFDLLKGFAPWDGSTAVFPKKYIEEKGWDYFGRNLIGSGPWKIVKMEPGARLDLEATENHWRAKPKFKTVTILNVKEEATKVAMLQTGELDMAGISAPDLVPGLKAAGLRAIGHYAGTQWYAALFYDFANPQKSPFSDVRVRKAMSLAIDRKELADKIYGGYAQPSAVFYASKTADYFDSNLMKPDPLDPDQAKKLLADAGYATGFATKLWEPGAGSVVSQGNLALAGYWRKVGINAEIATIDRAQLTSKFIPKPVPDLYNTVFAMPTSGGPLGYEQLITAYHSTKSVFKNVNNPKLDELIDKLPNTSDPAERKRLATEISIMGKNEYNVLTILDVDTLFALGPKVGGVTLVKNNSGLAIVLDTITHAK